jgi:hypothetical protein
MRHSSTGPAAALDVLSTERQFLSGGHPDHLLDEIEAGDAFGDRMLHLQPRVHLEKVKTFVFTGARTRPVPALW